MLKTFLFFTFKILCIVFGETQYILGKIDHRTVGLEKYCITEFNSLFYSKEVAIRSTETRTRSASFYGKIYSKTITEVNMG